MKDIAKILGLNVVVVLLAGLFSQQAYSKSHRYINSIRSVNTNYYFEHEYEGYNGQQWNGSESSKSISGSSINSSVGVEYFGLFQLEAGHQALDLDSSDESLLGLEGSVFNAGVSLFFVSPLANFEVGAGSLVSDLDARNITGEGKYYGSGLYRTLGLQYFVSTKASLHFNLNEKEQKLTLSNGNDKFTNTKNMYYQGVSLGFKLWL